MYSQPATGGTSVISSEHHETTSNGSANRLQVTVGNEAFPPGRTRVDVDSSGRLLIVNEVEGSDTRREEARIDPDRARELTSIAGAAVARVSESKRYGLPDEPRYHIEIGEGGSRHSIDVWRSELAEHPELNRIVTELQAVLAEQVKGEIIL